MNGSKDGVIQMTVDIPGAFTEWFEGSGVIADTDDKLDDASRELRRAYNEARVIRRGRAVIVRVTTADPEALWALAEYADTVVRGGTAADYTSSEIRAAKAVLQRVQQALTPVYEARYPEGTRVRLKGWDDGPELTVNRVTVDVEWSRVVVMMTAPGGSVHSVGAKDVILLGDAAIEDPLPALARGLDAARHDLDDAAANYQDSDTTANAAELHATVGAYNQAVDQWNAAGGDPRAEHAGLTAALRVVSACDDRGVHVEGR